MSPFQGCFWRIFFAGSDPLRPAAAPEGRFHHSGQLALYGSLSAEGCGVALKRYLGKNDPPRLIQSFDVTIDRLVNLRELDNPSEVSVVWQDGPRPSPTWAFSDAAREQGAQGMLYPGRTRPELTHIVLFEWSDLTVTPTGPTRKWHAN